MSQQWNKPGDRVLYELLAEMRRANELQIKSLRIAEENSYLLSKILTEFHPGVPYKLTITRIDGDFKMGKVKATAPLSGNINPGETGIKIQGTFSPVGAVTPPTFAVTYDSSDTNVVAVADPSDPSGLTADVSVANAEAVGVTGTITLNATGTNADGTPLSVSGQWAWTIVAVSEQNPTGIDVERIA